MASDDLQEYVPPSAGEEGATQPEAAVPKAKLPSGYLLSYSWAILLALAVLAVIYFFLFSKPSSSACVFQNSLYCKGVIFTANSFRSNVGFFVENQQSKTLAYPRIVVNFSGVSTSGNCTPVLVLEGGDMVCNVAFSKLSEIPNATVSGTMYLNAVPCSGGNLSSCSGVSPTNFTGKFVTRVLQSNQTSSTSITLEVNTTSPAANGGKDTIIATVQFLGSPLPDANVTFSQTGTFAALAPTVTTTDSNGRATTNISSTKAGSTIVTATFAGESANMTINFTTPATTLVQVAPDISSLVCSQQNSQTPVLSVDGNAYTCSQLPLPFQFAGGSQHRLTCLLPIPGGTGVQYVFSSANACGAALGQNGTFTAGSAGSSCTVSCDYVQEYFLKETASPASGGSLSPGSLWVNAGGATILSESPNSGYVFLNWVGTGTGSYTGTATSTVVIVRNPITEIANFKQSAITTTSTTITVTSTTSTTVTITSTTSTTTTGTSTSTTSTTSTSTTSTSTTSTSSTSTSTTSTTSIAGATGVLLAQPPNSIGIANVGTVPQTIYYTNPITANDEVVAVFSYRTARYGCNSPASDPYTCTAGSGGNTQPAPSSVYVNYLGASGKQQSLTQVASYCSVREITGGCSYFAYFTFYTSVWAINALYSGPATISASGPVTGGGGLVIYELVPSGGPGNPLSITPAIPDFGHSSSVGLANSLSFNSGTAVIGAISLLSLVPSCSAGLPFQPPAGGIISPPIAAYSNNALAASEYGQNLAAGSTTFPMTCPYDYWAETGASFS